VVRARFGVVFDPANPYKICDVKPALGYHDANNNNVADAGDPSTSRWSKPTPATSRFTISSQAASMASSPSAAASRRSA
jgi:hypothetical protein